MSLTALATVIVEKITYVCETRFTNPTFKTMWSLTIPNIQFDDKIHGYFFDLIIIL